MADFKMDDYIDVAARIVEFREKHPEGSLQQLSVEFREFADQSWVIYTAAAYRTPDDTRPGHGTAWEAVPGKTPYTKGSELQNAETSAWGRAIVAALAADTKRGIATAEDVRNRSAERGVHDDAPPLAKARARVWKAAIHLWPLAMEDERLELVEKELGSPPGDADVADWDALADRLERRAHE
jgi:hypothetical protein